MPRKKWLGRPKSACVPQLRRSATGSLFSTLLITGVVFWAGLLLTGLSCFADGSADETLSLAEAIHLALHSDPDLRQAEIDLEIARLEFNAEISRFLLPTVGLSLSLPDLTESGWSGDLEGSLSAGLSLPLGTSSQLSGRLSVSWDPATNAWNLGGWNLSYTQRLAITELETGSGSIDRRRRSVLEAEARLAQTEAEVAVNVARTFSKLLSAEASLSQAESTRMKADKNFQRIQDLFDAGAEGEATLIKAKISLLDAQIAVEERQAALDEVESEFFSLTLGLAEKRVLVPPDFSLEDMMQSARDLLSSEDLIAPAVASSSAVRNARDSLVAAEEALGKSQLGIDPDLAIQAGYSENGWSIGWAVSLTLFAPNWSEAIDIVRLQVELAEERLRSAEHQAEASILSDQMAMRNALRALDRLPLEQEKWALEEQMTRRKLEAGSISEESWDSFLEEMSTFLLDANGRSISLFVALLEYRNTLEFGLEWEEWLQ